METRAVALGEVQAADEGHDSDEALAARFCEGEAAAFDELYLRHRDRIHAMCVNLCGDREDAEDLLQETFVRAYRGLPRFRQRSQFSTWLYRICVNLCRDAARRKRRCPDTAPAAVGAERGAEETAARTRAAMLQLRPGYRTVLALRYGQSLSYQEMAKVLDWSLSRVKVTLHRARFAFREAYVESGEE